MKEGFRFFITCEYGEKKHRPHYHGIILFNSKISHEQMYKLCQDAWCGTTEVIPNNKKAPRKNHGFIGDLNSFIPRDNYACGAYVAKYVCKDIEFANTITGKFDHLTKKQKNHLRHFLQFHKQSMCFGSCIIKDKNDEELMEMFKNGIMFTGYDKMTKLPAYIKNKLLFTTHKKYNLNTHKHETIKSYTKFFYDHKAEIYDIKFKQNVKYLEQYGTKEYWQTHKYIDDATTVRDGYKTATEIIDSVGIGELSYFYTLYFGVPYEYCKWFKNPAEAIFARYNPCADLENLPLIDKDYYDYMSSALQYLMGNIHLIETVERSKEDELIDQIRAYFNN